MRKRERERERERVPSPLDVYLSRKHDTVHGDLTISYRGTRTYVYSDSHVTQPTQESIGLGLLYRQFASNIAVLSALI